MAAEMINKRSDIIIFIGIASYFASSMPGTIKCIILYINRKRVGRMINSLHFAPFALNKCRGGKKEENILKSLVRKTNIQNIIYISTTLGTLLFGIINTLYYRLRYWYDSSLWVMPYAPTMPWFDYSSSPIYEYGALFQCFSMLIYAIQIGNSFSIFIGLLAHISIQMVILSNAFRNLKIRAENLQKLDDDKSKPFEHYVNIIFRENINHHLQIFELANEMEKLYSVIILILMFSCTVIMCFVLYCCLVFPVFSMFFLQNATFSCIIFCHIAMYCYWGNEVSETSLGVAQAAAEVDWVDLPGHIPKSLIMVIIRAQKPLRITAGKFFPLNMATFMSIMRGTFSFLMFFKESQELSN
ncbi:PREDICTED: odorant receptor 30a-like [Nicrophorus vespilloides]|uniref:Odorant receptor n=1 Tax=Nicrophorus vespilloides TaxID=110193 RepID=A0ABM1N5N8_NICVS|nr:PREDICTED: odorant receptor 30a-like [Nicrophorus vespilloides]